MYCFECGERVRWLSHLDTCRDCYDDHVEQRAIEDAEWSEMWTDYERSLEAGDVAYEADEMAAWDAEIALLAEEYDEYTRRYPISLRGYY